MYVGLPTTGNVFDSNVHAVRELEKKYGGRIEFVYPKKLVRRMFHDYARNMIVEEFLESNCDVLWFLDSDVSPSANVLDLITEHWDKWKVAGAPYPVFMTPPGEKGPQIVFTVYIKNNDKLCPSKIPYSGINYVDGVATGCMFIKREVFEKLEKPYFEFKFRQEDRYMEEGEDLGFCLKVSKLGYQFFIDYSMVCKHQKTLCLLELNNYAIEYANKSVAAYDQTIRSKIQALEARVRGKMGPSTQSKSNLILPDWPTVAFVGQ